MKNRIVYDIFISYRRDGGYDTAQLLYDRLTQMRYRVSFDLETLREKGFVFEDCTLGGARRRGVGSTLADRLPAEAWTKEHLRKELNR